MLYKWIARGVWGACLVLASVPAWAGGWVFQHDAARMQHALRIDQDAAQPAYLCRVSYGRAMYPGIAESAKQSCRFLYQGKVLHRERYQLYMTTPEERPVQWQEAGFGGIPKDAWAVGWGLKNQLHFVCRVHHQGKLHFGMVRSVRNGYCDTFDHTDTRDFHHYEVLTLKHDRYAHIWF